MLGVITLKDHSLAPVSQGTKAMDTIVQVKFFGFFQVHLKQFSTISLSLRGDCWHVLKSMRKRECVLTVTDYIWSIYGGYYTVARRYEFYFRVAKQYFMNERSESVVFLLHGQKDINKIMEGNYRNYVIDKTHVWDYGKYTIPVPHVVLWILRVLYFPVKHSCVFNRAPMGEGVGGAEPGSPNIFFVEPGAPSLRCLEP